MTDAIDWLHSDWKMWFAWHPVKTENGWRWLCFVDRRMAHGATTNYVGVCSNRTPEYRKVRYE